ncbi:hypothetical protein RvY_14531 [Ramazzottius varieornatus]|uniref:Uncharacterized protein n=1 Tax=Ramazzottius varieornatus TaxID=947166 RepID=A0A1D1W034_RAMVA|nr:hypothetical protein RvY_14531 [Ramazzottius varieornatus]
MLVGPENDAKAAAENEAFVKTTVTKRMRKKATKKGETGMETVKENESMPKAVTPLYSTETLPEISDVQVDHQKLIALDKTVNLDGVARNPEAIATLETGQDDATVLLEPCQATPDQKYARNNITSFAEELKPNFTLSKNGLIEFPDYTGLRLEYILGYITKASSRYD